MSAERAEEAANNPEGDQHAQIGITSIETPGTDEPALLFCPVCDSRLCGHRCKLICRQCGYFMSCADYY
ncbi:MAG TPA: hypothetical protein VH351_01090 [Bryobacteraceae bacterium]|jgi:hypothetical protein|nr:hypothetical protein [Bryobacteraceae bacterium]